MKIGSVRPGEHPHRKTIRRFQTRQGLCLVGDALGDETQPPVLLLHGGGQTRRSWKKGAENIAKAGYYVVAYDARGHGESDWAPSADYSIDAMVDDLRDILDQLPNGPVLVGASLGGITALNAVGSDKTGTLARALVLVDVAPTISSQGSARILEFMQAQPDGFTSLTEVADAIAAYNPHRTKPYDLKSIRNNVREVNGRFFWHWDPAFLATRPYEPDVFKARNEAAARNTTIPTLLIRGEASDLIMQEHVDHFVSLMPHAEYREIAGAGHMVAGDRNDPFNAAVLDFLDKIIGSQARVA